MDSRNVSVRIINENNSYDYAWKRLRLLHDVESSVARLMDDREIPKKHKSNVQKQMEQLSYCLNQGQEFAQSARMSGLTTKALLAYYSITSLANAEILWRGNGEVSLDRRRSGYNRHGFELAIADKIEDFSAVPAQGLFGLWRKYSRHIPHYGEETTYFPNNTHQKGYRVLSSITPLEEIVMTEHKFTIVDCFQHIPQLNQSLRHIREESSLLRGLIRSEVHVNASGNFTSRELTTIIHPNSQAAAVDELLSLFEFEPNVLPDLTISELPNGALFQLNYDFSNKQYGYVGGRSRGPESFSNSKRESFFVGNGNALNEFGYYYVGLYILGMISRYHPQTWIKELKKSSAISHLVDQFIDIAIVRSPLLVLGQIDNEVLLYD